MAYATYVHRHARHVGEVAGDRLVPLRGLTEIGTTTPSDVLRDAERDDAASIPLADAELLPAVPRPDKIICVGLNYADHIRETGRETPDYPVLFTKYASSLIGPAADIALPAESREVDYEGELAVVIGTAGRRIPRKDAPRHVAGYAVANDVTMRDYQYKTHQWLQGKAWDASTPLGPYLVPPHEVELAGARIRTELNGRVVQSSTLDQLIFDVPALISLVSEFTALVPGDVILTGTPGGVGYRRDPRLFLRAGDTVTVEIDGVGRIRNRVVSEAAATPHAGA